ncbi:MAG TPA: Gfo/Idh/MocA family oxidoreductase [Candidatus Limnocylindrales bacterium]|nr:Gfo/Idh/MocA family oxidoreductase [Candidatus Limnocylindrales bacterium]
MGSSKLRWGVLSTADIARSKWIPGVRRAPEQRGEVVAIASRSADVARRVADELRIPRAHGSYEALLADPDVDAVYVPLPNHLHLEWVIAAARAGKHVLCEKPLALSSTDAQRMVDACDAAGVQLMEAFMYRLHPSWQAVRAIVSSGRIGRLQSVQSWFSYWNDDPANIRNQADAGGGALMDIGCYSINLSRLLFGSEPERVEASCVRDPDMGIDVLTSALLVFPGGGTATFTCSTRAESDQRVHVYGTEGRISVEIPFNIPPDRETHVFMTHGGDPPVAPNTETLTFPIADPYGVEADAFAAAVLDGTPVPTPPADGVANMRVIEQVFAAAARGSAATRESTSARESASARGSASERG